MIKIVFFLVFLAALFWVSKMAFDVYKERSGEVIEVENVSQEKEVSLEEDIFMEEDLFPEEEGNSSEKTAQYEIKKGDCENECADFSIDNGLEYCQQVCGLASTTSENQDCSSLEGAKKDYCWRDQGIKEKNFQLCDNISDKNIFQQCKTRIMEDIVDESSL